eukprot:9103392-Pyramimonas_sp.AAC.1
MIHTRTGCTTERIVRQTIRSCFKTISKTEVREAGLERKADLSLRRRGNAEIIFPASVDT